MELDTTILWTEEPCNYLACALAHGTCRSCGRGAERAVAMQGSWHSRPFFPDYQYLLVCSHRSLENTRKVGLNVIRLWPLYLQACLQQE